MPFEFYPLTSLLTPDPEKLTTVPKNAAILVIDYFGLIDMDLVADSLHNTYPDSILIADKAMGPTNLPSFQKYKFIYTSLRKFLAVTDGAEVFPHSLISPPTQENPFVEEKLAAAQEKHSYLTHNERRPAVELNYLRRFAAAESLLDKGELPESMSEQSERLLRAIDPQIVVSRRRANYQTLATELAQIGVHAKPLLPAQAPLCFPLWVNFRDDLRNSLREGGIFCPAHWPSFAELPSESAGRQLANHAMGLPLDQRYDTEDMVRMAATVRMALQQNSKIAIDFLISDRSLTIRSAT